MKTFVYAISVALACAGLPAYAQGKKGKGPDEHWRAQSYLHAPPAAQAKVSRLLINPFGEVDGLLLEDGVIVTYPAHMGAQLAAVVKPGDAVIVKGYPEAPGQIKGYVVTNAASGQSVLTLPKPPPGAEMPKHLRGAGLREMTASGEIRQIRFGRRGEINGAILADGTIVRVPSHAAQRFGALLAAGQRIAASGYGTQNQFGRAFEATALAPEGQPPQPLYAR